MTNLQHPNDAQATDVVISLRGISVLFRVPTDPVSTLKERGIRLLKGQGMGHREFWALQSIELDVHRGEVLGIIGRNGAGKSTLLKVISRILRPTGGRVWVRGRIAPLIELGAGFHPELTGRENVYLNGAILGFSQAEMDERFERIVEFAELGDFIHSPLRTYSSGMKMRLGFAVATDVDPDILIIDEILSVGDKAFQEKCMDRMGRFREQGATILFVSHSLASVKQLCTRTIWIHEGHVQEDSSPEIAINRYQAFQTAAA